MNKRIYRVEKISSSTSNLKKEPIEERKNNEQEKRVEKNEKHVLITNPLENIYFLCSYQGSVYRFFKEEEHANALARGDVYLSTLETCRAYEDAEQGDPEEAYETYLTGSLAGNANNTQFVEQIQKMGIFVDPDCGNANINFNFEDCSSVTTLPDAYVLCTTTEFSPENLNEKFGRYCVEIKDPRSFFKAISEKINSKSVIYEAAMGQIIYADRNYTGLDQPPGPIGFVKPSFPYEKQKEFRFLWVMENMGELNPPLLKCPEISHLCRRVDNN